MSKESSPKVGVSRRDFLKTTGLAAGAAMLTNGALSQESIAAESKANATEEQTFISPCVGNCGGACALKVTVRGGRVVQTSPAEFPDPEWNRICLRGVSHLQRVYGDYRLKYPLRRVGERGSGEWERISWEEAISEICTTWKKIIKESGATALAFKLGGVTRLGGYSYQMIPAKLGSTSLIACDDFAGNYITPLMIGEGPLMSGNEAKASKLAKTIVVWAANPTDSLLTQVHFLFDAMENGAKLIVIDPIFTTIAAKADDYVPIKIGTDAVLGMAMIKHIINEGLDNVDFLKTNTVAPLLVKESDKRYLRASDLGELDTDTAADALIVVDEDGNTGKLNELENPVIHGTFEINGIKVTTAYDLLINALVYTPEDAERICGVPADKVRELARIFATEGPVTVKTMMGMDHYYNGHTGYFALGTLCMVTGQLGEAGKGWDFGYLEGWNINWAAIASPEGKTVKQRIPTKNFPYVVTSGEFAGNPVQIRAFFNCGKNPVANADNRNAWIAAFNKMDLVVSPDFELSDTAQYADIVLPIAHVFETEDIYALGCAHPYDIFGEKCVDPLFECKSDIDVTRMILKGMGESFDYTNEEYLALALDTPLSQATGCTYEGLKKNKIVHSVLPSYLDENGMCINGLNGNWATSTGRAQFYLEDPKPRCASGVAFDLDVERLPHWEPPAEAYEGVGLDEKYPLILINTHTKWRCHTQFTYCEWLRELDPEPNMYMNPADAHKRGIADGEHVRVFNDRGDVVVKAIYDNGIQPGVLNIPKGWQNGSYISGHYQNLTTDAFHPFTSNHIPYDTRVQVEKYSRIEGE